MDSTVLGIEACQRLGLVEGFDSAGIGIPAEYVDAFKGFGCRPGECKIKVDPSVPPVKHAPGKVPVALHERAKKELQKMVNDEYDQETRRTNRLDNSTVTVEIPKKLRICIDPRGLNKAIKREHFPIKND